MPALTITEFTDPACPWAFSAEPHRLRLRWLYGDALAFRRVMVVLAESEQEYLDKGFTPERLALGMEDIQRRFAMPIDPSPRPRIAATVEACRAVVAARLHGGADAEVALLRGLRIGHFAGELLDDPAFIDRAAQHAGLDADELRRWVGDPDVEEALRADMAEARHPRPEALALDHKLAPAPGSPSGRRYTCPSYRFEAPDGRRLETPGFQPVDTYEVAVANLAPELERRVPPESVEEVLAWAGEPLASAEVAAICGLSLSEARDRLEATSAHEQRVGLEGFWSLQPVAA